MANSGYYKKNGNEWLFGRTVHNASYQLTPANSGDHTYPVDGWTWLEEAPATDDYSSWLLRVDAANTILTLDDEAPGPNFLPEVFDEHKENISNFILNGDNAFLLYVEGISGGAWNSGNPSIKDQIIDLLEPLVML